MKLRPIRGGQRAREEVISAASGCTLTFAMPSLSASQVKPNIPRGLPMIRPAAIPAAGATDALGDAGGARARRLGWAEIAAADPDALVLCPCSSNCERTLGELRHVDVPEFWGLRAVRDARVWVVDHEWFSRPGPRLVDGVEMLAKLLYPSAEISTPSTWEKRALKLEPCAPGDAATARDAAALAARFAPCFAERRESASADDEPTVDASDPWAGDVPLTAD